MNAITQTKPASAKSPSPEDKQIGVNLRRIRRAKKITQAQLGEMLPIPLTFQQMQKYEAGTNRISAARLMEFARILEVDLYEFFKDIDYERRETSPMDLAAIEARAVTDTRNALIKNLHKIRSIGPMSAMLTVSSLAVLAEEDDE